MVREDGKRNFQQIGGDSDGSVFSGNYPRQAALKAARRLDPASSEEAAPRREIRLREKGTDKVHVYNAWAWKEPAPSDSPDWLGNTVNQANVAKQGIEHIDG